MKKLAPGSFLGLCDVEWLGHSGEERDREKQQ